MNRYNWKDLKINDNVDLGRTCVIYKFTNLIDGKVYIGQTKRSSRQRLTEHFKHVNDSKNKRNYPLYNAIKKYGASNFSFEILHYCDIFSINVLEIFNIEKYNSTNKKFGYNRCNGGSNANVWEYKDDDEKEKIKEKIKESQKNGKTENFYKAMENTRGENHWNYGKHLTNETKEKISETLKNKYKNGYVSPNKKPKSNKIKGYEVIGINNETNTYKFYKSPSCTREDGFDPSCVSKCVKKLRKQHKGYEWLSLDEFLKKMAFKTF